ncbi:hypothetical protein HYX10_00695 [Candidatus Woesearchaeota archaeon]|nr:hypothetical protein [Candidatus Woesearchaeota archaeon]
MIANKLSKHDRYVIELCERIKEDYDSVSLNVPVRSDKRLIGEADIIARKGSSVDVYEVKCSHRIIKARKQLRRLGKYFSNINKFYFYCGSSGLLVLV